MNSAADSIDTRFTRLVGVPFPIMQEGLGPYKTVHLAAAVANAGALGTVSIPGISEEPEAGAKKLRGYIEDACELTDGVLAVNVPVGVDKMTGNVLPFSNAYVKAVVDSINDTAVAKRLRVITTSAGPPGAARALIEDTGLVHIHKVGSTSQAIRAEKDGVDAVIASGYEAGGHTHTRPVHTFILVPSVTQAVNIPVILAGGARDGRSLAAALTMGADAIAFGTRFVASTNNPDWDAAYGDKVVATKEGDDIIFSAIYGPSRALHTEGIDELATMISDGADNDTLTRFKDDRLIAGQRDGDMIGGILPCGQIAGALDELVDVSEFIPQVIEEARGILQAVGKLVK